MDKEKIIQSGKIAKQVREFAESFIKKDTPLLEIAEKIESKIKELGGKPAFPTNLSINEIAAHCTPSHDDKTPASGLLKVDFGVHVDGWIADLAFSIDLENDEENKKLIQASKDALDNALSLISKNHGVMVGDVVEDITTSEIGKTIQETIESDGFSPVINLSGHEMKQYDLHAGIIIPNIDDNKNILLKQGLYAIEPFATTGNGKVHDGKPSGIYMLTDKKTPRSQTAREVLNFIIEEYSTLPFCARWLVKELGIKSLFGLKQLEDNGNLHNFPQLVEIQGSKVAQTEHTILIEKDKIIVTTR